MIGQKKLIQKINSLDELPHSILLLGEYGSEQLDVCEYIADKFGLLYKQCLCKTVDDLKEIIDEIETSMTFSLYVLSDLDEVKQNMLLKTFEEPSAYAYIILLADSNNSVVETIQTRSYQLTCDTYTKDMIRALTNDANVLQFANTPGQVKDYSRYNINDLKIKCTNFIEALPLAPLYKLLTIVDAINFTDEFDKYDYSLFIKVLKNVLTNRGDVSNYLILSNALKQPAINDKQKHFEHIVMLLRNNSLQLAEKGL